MSLAVPGLEKKKHENPYNYTEAQLADKDLALRKLKDYYPTVPTYYAELVYDMCVNTEKEKLEEIMKKIDSEPSKYVIPEVLVSNKMECIDAKDSLEYKQ
jgi:glycine betaine/choline ABC-type transport system substrate-binding protein